MPVPLGQDLGYALRQLRKSPGFTAVAVLTLALGIGANSATFSVLNAIMLRTLAVSNPQSLVLLKWRANAIPKTALSVSYVDCLEQGTLGLGVQPLVSQVPFDMQGCSFSPPFFDQIRGGKTVFSSVAAFAPVQQLIINFEGRTAEAQSLFVSGDFFSTLGIQPSLGRLLGPVDDTTSAPPAIVVSHRFWLSRLGADPSIVGKQIQVGKTTFRINGVTGPDFSLDPGISCDLWLPFAFRYQVPPYPPNPLAANALWVEIIARLQPGVSANQAASAVSTLFAESTSNGPDAIFKSNDAPRIELSNLAHGLATLRKNFSRPLLTLLVGVAMVLLIACANLAGLMLARTAARRKELALRIALGAARTRVMRQMLTESLLLSSIGGASGILTAYFADKVLVAFLSRNWVLPLSLNVHLDARVFLFTQLISVLVGIIFGLGPAFSSWCLEVSPALKDGDRGCDSTTARRMALGSSLVAVQVVLTMLVLTGAGLMARTVINLEREKVGFNPNNLVVFRTDATYSSRAAQNREDFYRELQQRLSSLPGVLSATRSGVLLISGVGLGGPVFLGDGSNDQARAHFLPVASDFLRTMQIPLLQGRALDDQDWKPSGHPDAPTHVVVNEALEERFFAGQNPIGKYFHVESATGPEQEIVGVVSKRKYGNVRDDILPMVYTPIAGWTGDMFFELRSRLIPQALIPEIRDAVRRFDRSLLIADMKTQTEQIDQNIYQERLIANVSSLFALLALLIACIGLYGLLSFRVARRTQEIGIRLALGARREDVLRLVVAQGAKLAIVGAVVGAAAATLLSRYLQSLLFDVKPFDPLTLTAVTTLMMVIALLASYIPARRAAKVDPMVTLKYE